MTPIPLLFFVIVVQIVIFQFLSIRLTRAFPQQILGAETLPADDLKNLEEFHREAGRSRIVLGTLLLLVAAVAVLILPFSYREEKITLAIVSIVSSLGLVLGLLFDRRRFMKILNLLPDPPYRVASLRRRGLKDYYAPAWEVVPALIVLATIGSTIWLVVGARSSSGSTIDLSMPSLWIYPILQIAVFGLMTVLGVLAATRPSQAGCLAKTRAYHDRPVEAHQQAEILRRKEVLYDFLAKTGVLALLAISQLRHVPELINREPAPWLGPARWVALLILLALFGAYLWGILRVRRSVER